MPPGHQSIADEELARQAQGGSLSDFEELVHRYEARIYRFVFSLCRNETDARELTQETFVSAFLNLRRFDAGRSFATWLFTMARRKCIDRHRAARPAHDEVVAELPDENDPSVILVQREAEQDVWQLARRTLPALQFQTLWLKYVEEMSVREIARVLGRTQAYVKVLLFRARTTLARTVEKSRAQTEAEQQTDLPRQIILPKTGRVRSTPPKLAGATRVSGM